MVSVIIPVYNTEAYLEECIQSVVNQTYRNLEIIMINDGSTDHSGEICRKWERLDSRIRYIEKRNEGQGITRNLGIRLAEGKYVLFVDSDDYLDTGLVWQVRSRISEQGADICVFSYRYAGKENTEWPLEYKTAQAVSMKESAEPLGHLMPLLCNKMFSAELVKRGDIAMSNRICEDLVFNAQLYARADRICFLDSPLYNYRYMREGNLSTSYDHYFEVRQSVDELNKSFQRDGHFEACWMQLYEVSFHIFKDILFRLKKRSDLNVPLEVKNQYADFFSEFKGCLNQWFSKYLDLELQEKSCVLAGSYNLRVILHAMLLDEDFLKEDYGYSSIISLMCDGAGETLSGCSAGFKNAYRKRCVEQDVNKTFCRSANLQKADYIVIDLLDEIYDLVEIREGCYITDSEFLQELHLRELNRYARLPFLCEERRRLFKRYVPHFADKLKQSGRPIIIVKNFLCERHSVYYDRSEEYPQADAIREQNRELEWCYRQLSECLPDAVIADASEFAELAFTHGDFSFGCKPVYYNCGYYQRMAVKISQCVYDRKKKEVIS